MFIEKFSRISYPMTTLQKKEYKILWTTKCEESFKKLKQLLTIVPILRIEDPNGDFVVFIYASKEGLSGVLIQNDCAIYYESWKLEENEQNYITHDIEL